MLVFQHYYKFQHVFGAKAKTRLICVASTHDYLPFERLRTQKERKETQTRDACKVGGLVVGLCQFPYKFDIDPQRKPMLILKKSQNISSIQDIVSGLFFPDCEHTQLAHGDMNNTADGLLFVLRDVEYINGRLRGNATLEVFIARHRAHESLLLWQLARLPDAMLWKDIKELRAKAKAENIDLK